MVTIQAPIFLPCSINSGYHMLIFISFKRKKQQKSIVDTVMVFSMALLHCHPSPYTPHNQLLLIYISKYIYLHICFNLYKWHNMVCIDIYPDCFTQHGVLRFVHVVMLCIHFILFNVSVVLHCMEFQSIYLSISILVFIII